MGDGERESERIHPKMPKYKGYHEVWALKIAAIHRTHEGDPTTETDGGATIVLVEEEYGPLHVDAEYMRRQNPQVGGYMVLAEDGDQSYWPAEVFEGVYTRVDERP